MNTRSHGRMPTVSALLGAAALVALTAVCADVMAQSHRVIVNGQRMNDAQLAELARRNCRDIPDGEYWLNTRNGAWGYAGNARVQGVFGEACRGNAGSGGAVNRDGTYGPFVTTRRAEEEANKYRRRGMRAITFHNGNGYYVRVSR